MAATSFANSGVRNFTKFNKFSVGNKLAIASGGTTFSRDGYRYHVFNSNGTFVVSTNPLQVEVFMIAGGGSGGQTRGGGGGAGEAHVFSRLVQPGSYSIVIGAGAAGLTGGSTWVAGNDGNNTTAFGFTVRGGGGGGGFNQNQGRSGGCGGGSCLAGVAAGGASTAIHFGQPGGAALFNIGSGGGGGSLFAGAPGSQGANSTIRFGGKGGDGINFPLNELGFFGGGGGGGVEPSGATEATPGVGGKGGGTGLGDSPDNVDARANSGAGTKGDPSVSGATGNGGSGVVIVRY